MKSLIVVDMRCFDPECRHYSSPEIDINARLEEGKKKRAKINETTDNLDEALISSEIFDLMDAV
jgi:hypothetical protein